MIRRILVMTGFLSRRVFFSLSGLLYVILALIYWRVLFPPQQGTPDVDNYVLIIGGFGAGMSFLVALSVAARANEAANYPLMVRLPSRVEYLTAVLLSSFWLSALMQALVALLALFEGPNMTLGQFLEIPPLWIATNLLSVVLALHASDFVAWGWSRVYVYGVLAIFLLGQSSTESFAPWLAGRFGRFAATLVNQGWISLAGIFNRAANWLIQGGSGTFDNVLGFVFWPFRAIGDAVISGSFTTNQALAPAVILLYATILFMLAADLFANKDLDFIE